MYRFDDGSMLYERAVLGICTMAEFRIRKAKWVLIRKCSAPTQPSGVKWVLRVNNL